MLKLIFICCFLFGLVNLSDVKFYEVLGISKKATALEIRQAYKKLAVKFHPDKNSDIVEQEKFLKITEAYETLKDPDKRRKYDLHSSFAYTRKYDYQSQAEYDNLYYNGLYHNDPFVDTLSGDLFRNYLKDGFYFVNFYSPFCPPCQNVAEHWKKLAELYKGIVKVGAVNCKHHNSFCYNTMRIGSYPTLLLYPNGKHGNYLYYQGERTVEAMDDFVALYLRSRVHVPIVTNIKNTERPIAYVLGTNRLEKNSLTRIAYQLNGLVTVVIAEDDDLRSKLAKEEYSTIVFKYKKITKELESTDEKVIVKEIVDSLPRVDLIGPEKLKEIRNKLRNGGRSPWVLYFSTKEENKLLFHQMMINFPNVNFGEVDCDKWGELCTSLHVTSPPGWGVLKQGGAYQKAHDTADIKDFIETAPKTKRLQTLSASDFHRILDDGDTGTWVLLVAPHESEWQHIAEPFTKASLHFEDDENVNFGILSCTAATEKICRRVSNSRPVVIVLTESQRQYYNGRNYDQLAEFIELLRDSGNLELTEQQILEISDASGRDHTWLVAYFPRQCGAICDQLSHEWMIVAKKLKPLDFVRVGVLNCARYDSGFCNNIRSPVARLYPIASGQHYSVSLQNLGQAPYILEWAFTYIDDSITRLNWQTFSKNVVAEELNPTSGKKPWLVYFHSPRCFRCYEMYADFAITGIFLNNAVQMGKVNCVNERSLCQNEQVMSYPSLKLYLNRNQKQTFSTVVNIPVKDYESMLKEIKSHLVKYDRTLVTGLNGKGFHIKHDEF